MGAREFFQFLRRKPVATNLRGEATAASERNVSRIAGWLQEHSGWIGIWILVAGVAIPAFIAGADKVFTGEGGRDIGIGVAVAMVLWLVVTSWSAFVAAVEKLKAIQQHCAEGMATAVDEAVQKCQVRTPAQMVKGFETVVSTIFSLPNPKLREAVIGFSRESLKSVKDGNGFALARQPFETYRDRAKEFYLMAGKSVAMTCVYTPLEYLIDFLRAGQPSHLPMFNGMGEGSSKPESFSRVRVMFVRDRLEQQLTAAPTLFAASMLWFGLFNTRFAALQWSPEERYDDVFMFDSTLMVKFVLFSRSGVEPRGSEGTLFLKAPWDTTGLNEPPHDEWRIFDEGELKRLPSSFRSFIFGNWAAPAAERMWDQYVAGLRSYIAEHADVEAKHAASWPDSKGPAAYRHFTASVAERLTAQGLWEGDFDLIEVVREQWTALSQTEKAELNRFLSDVTVKPFRWHIDNSQKLKTELASLSHRHDLQFRL